MGGSIPGGKGGTKELDNALEGLMQGGGLSKDSHCS